MGMKLPCPFPVRAAGYLHYVYSQQLQAAVGQGPAATSAASLDEDLTEDLLKVTHPPTVTRLQLPSD